MTETTEHRLETTEHRIVGAERSLAGVYRRFGRGDLVASVLGMLTALGTLVFLAWLFAAAAGTAELRFNFLDEAGAGEELAVVGTVTALVVVFLSLLVGGIAAGRMARYKGGLNGIGAAVWLLLLVTGFAALGSFLGEEYNAFAPADLPNWADRVNGEGVGAAAIAISSLAVVLMLLGAWMGGRIGESYHRRVDAAIVDEALR